MLNCDDVSGNGITYWNESENTHESHFKCRSMHGGLNNKNKEYQTQQQTTKIPNTADLWGNKNENA